MDGKARLERSRKCATPRALRQPRSRDHRREDRGSRVTGASTRVQRKQTQICGQGDHPRGLEPALPAALSEDINRKAPHGATHYTKQGMARAPRIDTHCSHNRRWHACQHGLLEKSTWLTNPERRILELGRTRAALAHRDLDIQGQPASECPRRRPTQGALTAVNNSELCTNFSAAKRRIVGQ